MTRAGKTQSSHRDYMGQNDVFGLIAYMNFSKKCRVKTERFVSMIFRENHIYKTVRSGTGGAGRAEHLPFIKPAHHTPVQQQCIDIYIKSISSPL
jgi:hypothetical protein